MGLQSTDQLNSTDEDGPEICEPDSDTCNGDNANRRCGTRVICTAACNCWDGNMNRTTNTPRFTDSTIEGQGMIVYMYIIVIVSFPGCGHTLGMRLVWWVW